MFEKNKYYHIYSIKKFLNLKIIKKFFPQINSLIRFKENSKSLLNI